MMLRLLILLVIFGATALSISDSVCADDAPAEKITYDDHIRPVFRQHCLACHSADGKKGDLALDSFASTLAGGASGEVVYESDLDSSRLWDLVSHNDEPKMPPNADRIPDNQLDLIRKWIEGGALENSGSVAKKKKKSGLAMVATTDGGKPEGPAAMPESLYRQPVVYTERAAAVTALAASPWAPLVAVAGQKQILFYHADTGELLGVVPFLEGAPQTLTFSRDGSLLLAAGGRGAAMGLAALYDVRTGGRLVTVGDELDVALAADVNPSVTLIALGGPQKVVRVFSTDDGSLAYEIRRHTDWITAVAFSPDGELLITADRNGGAFLWEAETGREIATLRGHAGGITSTAWRADSQVVATAGVDGTARLWNRLEGSQYKSWAAHGGGAESVRFAADGHLVTAGRDRLIRIWKPDGAHLKDIATFGDIALSACFTHDGKRVIAGDFTGEIRLLDVESGAVVAPVASNPPTLAMRVDMAIANVGAASAALAAATTEKQAADQAMTGAETEAARRAAVVADLQGKQREAEAARDAAAKVLEDMARTVQSTSGKVTDATATLAAATGEVQVAEAQMQAARSNGGDVVAAEQALAIAAEKVKQTIAAVEASQSALKTADQGVLGVTNQMNAASAALVAAQQSVETAQAAVDEFAPSLAAARETAAAKAAALALQQQAFESANQLVAAAKDELAAFAAAPEHLDASIIAADGKIGEAEQLLAATAEAEKVAAEVLAARKAAADEAAAKLAAVQAEFDQLSAAMNDANKAHKEKEAAAQAAAAAQAQAEAAAAQARADKELFEKAEEVRAEYSGS